MSAASLYPKNNNPNPTAKYLEIDISKMLSGLSLNVYTIALQTSSLHLPTNINPKLNAAIAANSTLLPVSTTIGTNKFCNSAIPLPA